MNDQGAERVSEERITEILMPWIKERVIKLLESDERIKAIKFVRDYTHYSFQEAKDFVDSCK